LALASKTFVGKAWTKFPDIPALKSVRFVQGSAKTVDCKKKRALIETREGGTEMEYDFFVAASGLRRVWPVVPQSTVREAYLEEASAQINALESARHGIVVVGGGRCSGVFKVHC
jgi:NADH dehydrogenase FAD-containing subunit